MRVLESISNRVMTTNRPLSPFACQLDQMAFAERNTINKRVKAFYAQGNQCDSSGSQSRLSTTGRGDTMREKSGIRRAGFAL